MAPSDAAAVAQLAIRLGVLTEEQILPVWDTVGKNAEPLKLLIALERKGLLTPLQSQKLLKGDEDGYFMGGFRILYKIASGSFGRVFRADDPRSGRIVAVKILRHRWSEDQQKIDLFNREGKVGMGLQHPNIVEIIAVGQDASTGKYYIVMEFVEGGNLREILEICKKMETPKALKLIDEAVAGLGYAYSKGLTHRDIKLTNILISSKESVAKLVDFGLARICADEKEQVDRTVDYAGLERLTGVKTGDVRSDIYFLGCVLYEMLSGRSPLEMTRDKHARMNPRRFQDVKPLTRQDCDAPPSVFSLVETMMALQPNQRPQTPSQLLELIRAARAEVDGGSSRPAAPPGVFVVEADESMQDKFRDGFKKQNWRVFVAIDPSRALDRYRQQPYQGLVVDAGTVGEDGVLFFDRIMAEAEKLGARLGGILMLAPEQADWQLRVRQRPNAAVMIMPVSGKLLMKKLREFMGLGDSA